MKVELLVSEWCPTCPQAERVWRRIATERDIEFAVLDLAQPEGRELAQRLRIRTIPAVVIDGELKAVGVQEPAEAQRMVAAAPARRRASPLHAGMLLSNDNRWFICGAMVWLIASGVWFAIEGALVTGDRLRPVGTHLFGAGFVLSLIYGLAAHMLPRFTGNPIASGAFAWSQFGSLNAGVALLIAGAAAGASSLLVSGGALIWVSLALHAWRIWPVLWPRRPLTRL
ncbi:MAG: thioredoxin family protein [Betaproteobacteria bacterium]|nr:thioredoxin family protein [Betaproteobacteria bacterium]